jgi:hypothetical protein
MLSIISSGNRGAAVPQCLYASRPCLEVKVHAKQPPILMPNLGLAAEAVHKGPGCLSCSKTVQYCTHNPSETSNTVAFALPSSEREIYRQLH